MRNSYIFCVVVFIFVLGGGGKKEDRRELGLSILKTGTSSLAYPPHKRN